MRGLLLAILLPVLLSSAARADPTLFTPAPGQGLAVWTFANPADYTVENATLGPTGATLAWRAGADGDTNQADFSLARSMFNVDAVSSPGDLSILNLSVSGPPITIAHQPSAPQLEDAYLVAGPGANTNYGGSSDLFVGYWGPPAWARAVLRFPSLPLPTNATIIEAELRLFLRAADIPDPSDLGAYRITTGWSESVATWNDYDGSNPWNTSGGGGDFDTNAVDIRTGITNVSGWYAWNVTSLAQDWWTGTVPNYGILLRQVDDELRASLGRKAFYSSDAGNASARPVLVLTYTAPGSSSGVLESRALDAGGIAYWQSLGWNGTAPAAATISFQSRTGNVAVPDGSWSPWSPPYASPGSPIQSPASRYLQYRATLATSTGTSPVLHDVEATYERFAELGRIVTRPFRPSGLEGWGRLAVDWTGPASAGVAAEYSQDGGSSWTTAIFDADLPAAIADPILLRITLSAADTRQTPRVYEVTLGYVVPIGTGTGGGWADFRVAGVPVWILLLPFGILAAWTLARQFRRAPFDATDAFLIHRDGRLVHRVGAEGVFSKDEDAVSGMFTLVADFVRDSFRGETEGPGNLKSLQIDDKDVAIGRGEYLYLALVAKGTRPPEFERNVAWFLRGLEATHRGSLLGWDGRGEALGDVPRDLAWFLRDGHRRRLLWPRTRYRCG